MQARNKEANKSLGHWANSLLFLEVKVSQVREIAVNLENIPKSDFTRPFSVNYGPWENTWGLVEKKTYIEKDHRSMSVMGSSCD